MRRGFKLADAKIDIVSNASNLRKIFDLVRNNSRVAVRFDIEMRGNTLLLSRWNEDPDLVASSGYGAGFERATCDYTSDDHPTLKSSASHHRVVSYSFAGLNLIVQSEVDAFYCDCKNHKNHESHENHEIVKVPSSLVPTTTPTHLAHTRTHSNPPPSPRHQRGSPTMRPQRQQSLLVPASFALLTMDDPGDSPTFQTPKPLSVVEQSPTLVIYQTKNCLVPPKCLVEVKTQSANGQVLSPPEAQLYFSRRTQLYVARHKSGRFSPSAELTVEGKEEALQAWEREEQDQLRQVAGLLRTIKERVKLWQKRGIKEFSLVGECGGARGVKVKLYQRKGGEGGGFLPS